MNLQELLGDELFSQVDAKIQEHNKEIEEKMKKECLEDLSEGGYVSKEKYGELDTAKKGIEKQLKDANATINSYKEMDIDGIKKSAEDWEKKYNEDTQKLNQQIENDRKTFAAERYIADQKIKSPLSRKAILQEFLAQNLEFKDGAFSGADEYMKKVREQYPDEFEQEQEPNQGRQKGTWVRGTQGTYKPETKSEEAAYLEKKYGNNKYAKK